MSGAMLRCLGVSCLLWLAGTAAAAESTFQVLLDGKPIGEHRFVVTGPDGAREVQSDARFTVKLLGVTVYTYRHQAAERWRGDCLATLAASTDDDGTRTQVRTEALGEGLSVRTETGDGAAPVARALPGCTMSFAYWNPDIRKQSRLLNAQTGKLEAVRVSRVGNGPVEVRGQSVMGTRWRIEGAAQPIDVWYSAQDDWIGLDSTLEGGRRLSYRLK